MSKNQAEIEETVEKLYLHAAELKSEGKTFAEIEVQLAKDGLKKEIAEVIAWDTENQFIEKERELKKTDLKIGIVVSGLGIGGTIITYIMAEPGGTYIVAWGLIGYGLFRLLRGMLSKADKRPLINYGDKYNK